MLSSRAEREAVLPLDRVCAVCAFRTAGWTPDRCPLCGATDFQDADAPWVSRSFTDHPQGRSRSGLARLSRRAAVLTWILLVAAVILACEPLFIRP